jgi:hypothetical protein
MTMAQTDFFAESMDCEHILRFAFECGLQLVPDLPYRTPDVQLVSNWEEMRDFTDCRLLFLLDFDRIQSPFAFAYVPNKDEYRLYQRKGGPALSLLTCRPYEREGIHWIPSGMLGYYATYLNTVSMKDEAVPDYLVAVYQNLVIEIKRGARLAMGSKREYWVMPHACSALASGAQLNVKGIRV